METIPESKGTILLADDIPGSVTLARSVLEGEGYIVLVVTRGENVFQRAAALQPDLILLDILMPGTDGYEICRSLKGDTKTHSIPVIFLSALSKTPDKVRGFEIGAVDFLTKPVDVHEMLARVRTHITLYRLQKKQEVRASVLQWEVTQSARSEQDARRMTRLLEERVAERTANLQMANEQLIREAEERARLESELTETHKVLKKQYDDLRMNFQELKETHDLLKKVAEHYHTAAVVAGDGTILKANRKFSQLIGAGSEREITGRPLSDFLHPVSYPDIAGYISNRSMLSSKKAFATVRIIRGDGPVVKGELSAIPVSYRGKPAILIVIETTVMNNHKTGKTESRSD